MVVSRLFFLTLAAMAIVTLLSDDAHAQQDDPVGPFVIDARVALPTFSSNDAIAAGAGVRSDQLPERGLGFEAGAHFYPLRRRRISVGLGANLVRASGRKAPGEDAEPTDTTIETRFSALTPQVSLNFGTTRGWSYISGGYGWTKRVTGEADSTLPDGSNLGAFNYGGGARWFIKAHVAFSFDLRFYRLPDIPAETGVVAPSPGSPGYTMFMGTAGLSFK
jgi:hypothetical protein